MTRIPVALFLISLGFLSSARAIDLPGEREHWITIQADEFSVFSNASESETVALVTSLLRMREAVGQITRLQVRSAVPTKLYIFRNAGSFAPYRDLLLKRGRTQVSGLFLGGKDANFILLQADSPGGIDRAIYHELTHYFVKNTLPGLPLWFNEGLAEYYSTFSTKGDAVNLGMPVSEHVAWLQNEMLIPLAKLFAINPQSQEYNEGHRQGGFYAESWALVHYLMGDAQHREKLGKFLALVRDNRPIDQSFQTAFGSTFEKMESELRSYVRRYMFRYTRYSLADLHFTTGLAPRPMSRDEILFELGDLLAHGGRGSFAEAEHFLNEAAKLNSNSASAYADLALIHDASGRTKEAQAEYERAVQLGARDAAIYLIYGGSLLQKIDASTRGPGGAPTALVTKARALFQKASELDPTSARAFAGFGATYVVSTDEPSAGIAALEKSLSLVPGQEDVAFNLVQLYARQGRRDEANRLTESVIAHGADPEMLRQAREAVLVADVERAERLLRAGKIEEGEVILRPLPAATTNDRLKAYVGQVLAEIDRRKVLTQQIDQLQSAVKMASEGKISAAIEAMDKILPTITDPALLDHARKLREELVKAKRRK